MMSSFWSRFIPFKPKIQWLITFDDRKSENDFIIQHYLSKENF